MKEYFYDHHPVTHARVTFTRSRKPLAEAAYEKARHKPIQVASRCSAHHTGTTIAGSVAVAGQTGAAAGGTTYRWAHVMETECSNLQFIFGNFYPTVTTESSNANPITIAVTLEYAGLITRLHFNGNRTVFIDQGGIAKSDPILRSIPRGATFFTRIWISVPAAGNVYPQGLGLVQSLGDGKAAGDLTLTAGAIAASSETGYGPVAIVGIPNDDDAAAFAEIGDSMVGDANGDGWPILKVQGTYGYMILSKPGSTVDTMERNSGNAYRLRLVPYATHAIVTFGANDWNQPTTFAVQEGYIKALWETLQNAGLEVYQTTSTPRTTSTDNWSTTANQTIYNGNSYNDKRLQFNKKLRNGEYDVRVLDAAKFIETPDGLWKPLYTGDGIHPLPAGKNDIVNGLQLVL